MAFLKVSTSTPNRLWRVRASCRRGPLSGREQRNRGTVRFSVVYDTVNDLVRCQDTGYWPHLKKQNNQKLIAKLPAFAARMHSDKLHDGIHILTSVAADMPKKNYLGDRRNSKFSKIETTTKTGSTWARKRIFPQRFFVRLGSFVSFLRKNTRSESRARRQAFRSGKTASCATSQ